MYVCIYVYIYIYKIHKITIQKHTIKNMSSPVIEITSEITLKHDINHLLFQFNKLDYQDDGFIAKSDLNQLFEHIKVAPENTQIANQYNYDESTFNLKLNNFYPNSNPNYLENYQIYHNNQQFQFQMMLSLLGNIQHPNQPAIYVLSFIKILADYRNKCIQKDQMPSSPKQDQQLKQAKQIDQKIRKIIKKELERQKQRMLHQHRKIYTEMEKSQIKQYQNFQQEWKVYLEEFQAQTQDKLIKTRNSKLKELSLESEKMVRTARRNSVTTSPKLQELLDKKKWLVKEGRYSDAIRINHLIQGQKKKIQQHHENSLDFALRKRITSLKKRNQNTLSFIESELKTNMIRLVSKKKEGENLMRIRMKNLQEEAHRKLNDHLRSQLSRLRGAFSRAAR